MIDTHAHIDFDSFDEDRNEVVARARDNGIENIIIPAVEPKDFNRLLDLVSEYESLYCAMGVHPHNATDFNEDIFQTIITNTSNPKVKAIGEIGIDYHYDFAPKEVQQNVFRRQLDIAKTTNLPAIVHNREADADVLKIIEEKQDGKLRGVLHCFSSSVETMQKALDLGFHISFTGNITFKKSTLNEVVELVPLDKIMIETDSPFMTPVPNRGKRNEPYFVKFVAEKIAEIKSISIDKVIQMTTKTAKNFFQISILLLILLLSSTQLFAQAVTDDEEFIDETPDSLALFNPYEKFIGIGLVLGTNTAVETNYLTAGEKDISYEGILAIGGAITYNVFDYLIVEAAYNYSKNTKIAEIWNYTIEPSIYQNIELATHWIINPYSRVNFYGTIGLTYFMNSFNTVPDKQIGWNSGVGMYINIPTSIGLLNISGEWRINFETETKKQHYGGDLENLVDTKSFYSIPRLTLLFYPNI